MLFLLVSSYEVSLFDGLPLSKSQRQLRFLHNSQFLRKRQVFNVFHPFVFDIKHRLFVLLILLSQQRRYNATFRRLNYIHAVLSHLLRGYLRWSFCSWGPKSTDLWFFEWVEVSKLKIFHKMVLKSSRIQIGLIRIYLLILDAA